MEELDSLEETLNDSIRESLGARSRKADSRKRLGLVDEEDDDNSRCAYSHCLFITN